MWSLWFVETLIAISFHSAWLGLLFKTLGLVHHDKSVVDSIYTQNNTNQKHMLHSESSVFIRIHLCVCRWIQITWGEWFNTAGPGNMVDEHVRMKMKLLSAETVGMLKKKEKKNKIRLHVSEQTNLPTQQTAAEGEEVFRVAEFWSRCGLLLKHKMPPYNRCPMWF